MAATVKIVEFAGDGTSAAGSNGNVDKTAGNTRYKHAADATVDSANPMVVPASGQVDRSFVKYLGLYCSVAPAQSITNAKAWFSATPPTGVEIHYNRTATWATPVSGGTGGVGAQPTQVATFPKKVQRNAGTGTPYTIASFTPGANTLVVIAIMWSDGTGQPTLISAPLGGGLTWNHGPYSISGNAVVDTYWAWCTVGTAITGVQYDPGTSYAYEVVMAFSGAASSIGNTGTGAGNGTDNVVQGVDVLTSAANSLLIGAGASTSSSTTRSFDGSNSLLGSAEYSETGDGDDFWVQYRSGTTNTTTTYTVGTTGPSESYWSMVGIEIKAGSTNYDSWQVVDSTHGVVGHEIAMSVGTITSTGVMGPSYLASFVKLLDTVSPPVTMPSLSFSYDEI